MPDTDQPQAKPETSENSVGSKKASLSRFQRWLIGSIVASSALILAAVTNPDRHAFTDRYAELVLEGDSFGRNFAKFVANIHLERTNYVFFSIFTYTNPDGSKVSLPGAFGHVWGLMLEKPK